MSDEPANETAVNYDPTRYERPSVTVDVVIFTLIERELNVLLVRRRRWPHEGMWAIPGGFVQMDESLETAAREVTARSGSKNVALFICDFSSQSAIRRLVETIHARYDRLDVVVNNAGGVNKTRTMTVESSCCSSSTKASTMS